jgi:tetratricopeptide (TPR) repeat protein
MHIEHSLRFFIAVLLLALPANALAEKPRGYVAHPIDAGTTYSQRARDAYAAGTWTVEEAEDAAANGKVEPAQTQRAYERALLAFQEAVTAEPSMYEAQSYLGYVYRKLGRYPDALRAYDAALKLKPDYIYAIEYQGEAYLALGDFARARFNYLRLYALDQPLAAKLLEAMRAWLTATANTGSADFFAARDWIEKQSSLTR